jgi:hypothetical protein
MKARVVLTAGVTCALAAVAAPPAFGSYLVDRNTKSAKLQVDAGGHALVSYVAGGAQKHVLIWSAVNALPPTKGKPQVAFKIDYSGGYKALRKANYFKTIKNVCRAYKGPKLAWLLTACTAPDGSSWALQAWQRMLPNLGFNPWRPDQSVVELRISHWKGPIAEIDVFQDWAWSNQYRQIVGQYMYGGKPVYGFGSTSVGSPTDSYGRNMYLDTFGSPYNATGWARENSFLANAVNGRFCYSLGPRPPYGGYPKSGPRQGDGKMYRITAEGPGVTPDVMWSGNDLGPFDAANPTDAKLEQDGNTRIQSLGFSSADCHA